MKEIPEIPSYVIIGKSLLESRVWQEASEVSIIYITFLLRMNTDGKAYFKTIERLAAVANVKESEAGNALKRLIELGEIKDLGEGFYHVTEHKRYLDPKKFRREAWREAKRIQRQKELSMKYGTSPDDPSWLEGQKREES